MRKKAKVSLILILTMLLFNCTKEIEEFSLNEKVSNGLDKETNRDIGLNTVSLEKSMDFFRNLKRNLSNSLNNPLELDIDLATLKHEDLTQTNQKLITVDAKTKVEGVISKIWQISVNDSILTVLFNRIPEKNNSENFSGMIVITDLKGNVLNADKIVEGKKTAELFWEDKISKTGKYDPQPCWGIGCGITLNEVILTAPVYRPPVNIRFYGPFGNVQTRYVNNNYYSLGQGYLSYLNERARFDLPFKGPKVNPKEELKCFNPKLGGKVTIYVEQPIKNSREITANIGHVFVGIEQNGISRYLGFYPVSNYASLLGPQESSINDNSGSPYHVSITSSVSANQLRNVINYINNYKKEYDLNNYNCTDFGIQVAKKAGLILPSTIGEYDALLVKFRGRNPADLGQDIRRMQSPKNGSINKNGGKAPAKKGKC